jgi:hypothetical protein
MQDKVRSGVAEDRITGAIESQTSKIPSSGYLAAAFGAITASAILKIVGKDDWVRCAIWWHYCGRCGSRPRPTAWAQYGSLSGTRFCGAHLRAARSLGR